MSFSRAQDIRKEDIRPKAAAAAIRPRRNDGTDRLLLRIASKSIASMESGRPAGLFTRCALIRGWDLGKDRQFSYLLSADRRRKLHAIFTASIPTIAS
jgi:hypothetical protein